MFPYVAVSRLCSSQHAGQCHDVDVSTATSQTYSAEEIPGRGFRAECRKRVVATERATEATPEHAGGAGLRVREAGTPEHACEAMNISPHNRLIDLHSPDDLNKVRESLDARSAEDGHPGCSTDGGGAHTVRPGTHSCQPQGHGGQPDVLGEAATACDDRHTDKLPIAGEIISQLVSSSATSARPTGSPDSPMQPGPA